jgi:hypothetical protein
MENAMNFSPETDKIVPALFAARQKFGPLFKRGDNPFHKSKYVILDDVLDMLETALTAEDLFIFGSTATRVTEYATVVESTEASGKVTNKSFPLTFVALTLRVIHVESGQWVEASAEATFDSAGGKTLPIQSFGSAVTYLRRYLLTVMFGLATESDDDGEATRKQGGQAASGVTPNKFLEEWQRLFEDKDDARNALAAHGSWNTLQKNPAKLDEILRAQTAKGVTKKQAA